MAAAAKQKASSWSSPPAHNLWPQGALHMIRTEAAAAHVGGCRARIRPLGCGHADRRRAPARAPGDPVGAADRTACPRGTARRVLMVHTRMSAIGWVVGGSQT